MQEVMFPTKRGQYDLDSKRPIDATTYLQMVYRAAMGRTGKECNPWIGLVLHFTKPTVIPFHNPFTGEAISDGQPEWSTDDVIVLEHDFRIHDDDNQIKIGLPPDLRYQGPYKGSWMEITINEFEELFGFDARKWLDDFNRVVGIVADVMRESEKE